MGGGGGGNDWVNEHGCSDSGGFKPMPIEGRMARQRERCIGMTDEERAWRAKWIKDQVLAPDEPQIPNEYYKQRFNPIRRFYRAPMDKVEAALTPKLVKTFVFNFKYNKLETHQKHFNNIKPVKCYVKKMKSIAKCL